MKKVRISYSVSERNGNNEREDILYLMVDNAVAEELTSIGSNQSKTVLRNMLDQLATLQTGDILAKQEVLDVEVVK